MRRAAALIGWLIFALLVHALPAAEPAKVLIIGKQPDHPYGSHMYLHTAGVLAKCLELTPGARAEVSDGWPQGAAQLAGVKSIVVYTNPAAELLLDGPQRDEVAKLVKGGVGLVTIHWASSVKKDNFERLGPTWLDYMGGTWVSNVGLAWGKSPLTQLQPDHPIARGWDEYEIDDEFYLNPTIEKAKPFLSVIDPNTKQQAIVGWTHERDGGGRSFATTLGHPYKNFQREPFRRMIANAILWTAHIEVPEAGARVDVAEEVLALPPEKIER